MNSKGGGGSRPPSLLLWVWWKRPGKENVGVSGKLGTIRKIHEMQYVQYLSSVQSYTSVQFYKYSIHKYGDMTATKRIPVSEQVWTSLSDMKKPGQTFDRLLYEIVEHEKERRFLAEMAAIEAEGNFVEFAP